MKLSTWARQAGVHPRTAYRWCHTGAVPVPARQRHIGTILVEPPSRSVGEVAAYAGVVEHATAVGLTPSRVSSGLELAAQGRQIMALHDGEVADGLVGDMVEVLTSMCVRLYGRGSALGRAQRAVEAAGEASA